MVAYPTELSMHGNPLCNSTEKVAIGLCIPPYHPDGQELLMECNLIVLILVLTLVSVGRPSAGACGSKKSVLLAFLLSIHLLQNYEHSFILE